MKVIAEGIESEEALYELLNLKCDIGQGYHICRPLPESEALAWYQVHTGLTKQRQPNLA